MPPLPDPPLQIGRTIKGDWNQRLAVQHSASFTVVGLELTSHEIHRIELFLL